MLVVVSDLHLSDGTCGRPISGSAFHLFGKRLQELAENASWRTDGTYLPVDEINILMLGDILDPLHSTLWLDTQPEDKNYTRPWAGTKTPLFAKKVQAITRGIIANNTDAAEVLRMASQGELVKLPPATSSGKPDHRAASLSVPARIFYMIGNHDWYYHFPGPEFDAIRQKIIQAFGLANHPGPFPYTPEESPELMELLTSYKVYARHGDIYDKFNFDKTKGRNASALGDVFTIEMMNRFPVEVERQLGDEVPPAMLDGLREMTNVRPVLAAPLWISGQITHTELRSSVQDKLKAIWDGLGDEMLALQAVRDADKWLALDNVDALEVVLKISKRTSYTTLNNLIIRLRQKMWGEDLSFVPHALKEKSFRNLSASYIVYGHTHHHEVVPLDARVQPPGWDNQLYFNTGTWHTYYSLAMHRPEEQKFVPYQVLTYLAFYHAGERQGRYFESWSGAFS